MMKRALYQLSLLLLLVFSPWVNSAEILYLLDRSESMSGSKLSTAKQTLIDLLNEPEGSGNNGVMIFGGSCQEATMLVPPNEMPVDLETQLGGISAQGGTPLAYALESAAKQFASQSGERHIVLISDGGESCKMDPCQAVRTLKEQGIQLTFHVVKFEGKKLERLVEKYRKRGKEIPNRLKQQLQSHHNQLQCIADTSGGIYQKVRHSAELPKTLRSIQTSIQTGTIAPSPWLLERFDGATLAWQWEVLKPNPLRYRMHDGYLKITAAQAGDLSTALVENTFRLRQALPAQDWLASMKITVNFRTQQELPFMGIYSDKNNYLIATLWAVSGCESQCAQLNAELISRQQGHYQWHTKNIWQSEQFPENTSFSEIMQTLPQALTLFLAKDQDTYTMSVQVGEDQNNKAWQVNVESLTVAEQTSGKFVFGIYQTALADTATKMQVDWLKIESVK